MQQVVLVDGLSLSLISGSLSHEHTDRGKFGPDVENHDHGHRQGDDMEKGRCALENDRIGQLDIAGIAVGNDAGIA